uniref:Uncharacterized protein n=1 Tax=Arundo donax TaxID=35708 RepID=A0A0A9F2K8_ARUDO
MKTKKNICSPTPIFFASRWTELFVFHFYSELTESALLFATWGTTVANISPHSSHFS